MKRLTLLFTICFLLSGCSQAVPGQSYQSFPFTHYSSGGTEEEYEAIILFEEANSTFTSYQVAFRSCTCRDPSVNYLSVAYVELLNNKPSPEDAAIRTITFGRNMGMWGDSNPNYYLSEYTEKYYDEYFVQPLVKLTKSDFDAWEGYGTQVEGIDADAVTGATVSTSNITSMLQGLFAYHTKQYYSGGD